MVATRGSRIPPIFMALVFALVMIMLLTTTLPGLLAATQAIDLSISHGVDRHGGSAVIVRNCLDNKGALQVWHNPTTNRTARICVLDDGKFGVQILTYKLQEVTSFIKDKMSRIEQVENYLRNAGYLPVQ
jgi:hypothetical protein